mgnify:CR=1 FL=1
MNRPLRIALTKGRLEKDTVGLLEKIGYDCTAIREKGRKTHHTGHYNPRKFLLNRYFS